MSSFARMSLVLAFGLLTLALAATAAGAQRRPTAISPSCTADQQAARQAALDGFVASMLDARRSYFRKHHKPAQRKAFVRRQQARLRALRRAAACQIEEPPPPAPPPVPVYQPGHYAGKTSQNENFEFDVSTDGAFLMNLVTGQINESCTPGGSSLYGGNIHWTGNVARISADGSFSIDERGNGTVGSIPSTYHLTISGHLAGAIAAGMFTSTTDFTYSGFAIACTSNPQTWSAARTGG